MQQTARFCILKNAHNTVLKIILIKNMNEGWIDLFDRLSSGSMADLRESKISSSSWRLLRPRNTL